MTKDERFLLALYKSMVALRKKTIDAYPVGQSLGLSDHLIGNIIRGLSQANFIKNETAYIVRLTPRGEELVRILLEKKN